MFEKSARVNLMKIYTWSSHHLRILVLSGEREACKSRGRRTILGLLTFTDRMAGLLEPWAKWSHGGPMVEAPFRPFFFGSDAKTAVKV